MSAEALRCAAAIRRVGCEARLLRGEEGIPFPASIQPRPDASGEAADPLGIGGVRLYTLYAPGDSPETEAGDAVECLGVRYRVLRAEIHCLGGEPVYRWCVLRRECGE